MEPTQKTELHLPFSTIAKILGVMLLVVAAKTLFPLMVILLLSSFVAVSLSPLVAFLQRKRFSRTLAIALITFVLAAAFAGIILSVFPKLFEEFSALLSNLPKIRERVLEILGPGNPLSSVIANFDKKSVMPKAEDIAPIFSAGNVALGVMTEILLVFVFSIYLLVDGEGLVSWFGAFFSPTNQEKIMQTRKEMAPIIFSYVSGQAIVSLVAFTYVLISMSVLGVPNALLLAALAGLFDILPVLGFFLSAIPALIFALSISGSTALVVLFLYLLYHCIENYFIIPKIYGKRLRVSSFVVLVALISAGLLFGIEGAILVLPLVASYPIIERIWLKKLVGNTTVADHATSK